MNNKSIEERLNSLLHMEYDVQVQKEIERLEEIRKSESIKDMEEYRKKNSITNVSGVGIQKP